MKIMQPSWQSKIANAYIKTFVRRRHWGDEREVARAARRVFGAPKMYQWLQSRGLRIEQIEKENVRGEWILPENAGQSVVLYIHGGGFVASSAAGHRPVTTALARRGNFKVFSLDYRLAPENRFPAALDDVVAAYLWLLQQDFAPRRVALAGDSAGGGLVISALLKLRDAGFPQPSCGVCFSPWTDLAATGDSLKLNDGRCAMFHPENMPEFAAAYLGEASPFEPFASPLFADFNAPLPPLLQQVGSTELLLDDARRIDEKIRRAGGESELEIYEDVPHCWQMFDPFLPEARAALVKAVEFIGRNLENTE